VYASISKALEFQNFQAQLSQSPLLSAYTEFISYTLLSTEILIAITLAIPKTRTIALYTSFAIMIMFTAYIVIILNYSSFIPCSCGGILEKLGWKEHLIFNCGVAVLTATACLSITKKTFNTSIRLIILALTSITIVIIMYLLSEKKIHQENPFIRRFIQGTATKTNAVNLNSNSLYFAGTEGNTIYLGDNLAPLHIVSYDTTLKIKRHYKIQLEREDFTFQNVQVRITAPYFFLMDGTVPVIYRGLITDWKAKIIMVNNNYFFSKAEIIAPNKIVFRAQEIKTLNNVLGTFTFNEKLQVDYAPTLLQKQVDGFFDTDGMLHFNKQLQKIVYTYFYRNQFIVADKNLKLNHRGKTIDTISKANIKVVFIKETRQRKLASIPTTVNQVTAVSGDLLFIKSNLLGRFEPKEMWKEAAIIDIYNMSKNSYLSSIYIYKINKTSVQDIAIIDNNLFAIIGHQLHKYHLSNKIIPK